jgi:hypothetical protein
MKSKQKEYRMKTALLSLVLALAVPATYAHEHLAAGAASTDIGAPLIFQNAADYESASGFVFNLGAGSTNDAYLGYYHTSDLVFGALATTPNNGGPEPGHAAPGGHIQIQLLAIDGPAGASFGFWETAQDGVDSTNLTWSVPVPSANGTNLIHVSENDGSPGSDPYGHLHGRVYSVNKPGLYKATWKFVDTSTNGPGQGPVNAPSAPFSLYYQADVTLSGIRPNTNGMELTFAAPSNLPDSGVGPATSYTVESSPIVGAGAVWQVVGDVVTGDDHLHTMAVPLTERMVFFRLQAE